MVGDEAGALRTPDILGKIINIEGFCRIDSKLFPSKFKYFRFRFHHSRLVGIDTILEECGEEIVFTEDMLVMNGADIGEEIKRGGLVEGLGPLNHRDILFKNPTPDIEKMLLGTVMGKGILNGLHKVCPLDPARFVIDAKWVE